MRKVACLIPAHNEEEGISKTIRSLLRQVVPNDVTLDIYVICDNCSDCTKEKVDYFTPLFKSVHLIETCKNKDKKSGALNCAYNQLGLLKYDYFLCVDADTTVKYDLLSKALDEFEKDPTLGAVCSRAGLIKQTSNSLLGRILYHLQKIEYAEFDASRIERFGFIKVVHGMCAVYKKEVIQKVKHLRQETGKSGQIYDVKSITEDYDLTLVIREKGYKVTVGLEMEAWTDVPLSVKDLWKQRVRWLTGGLDTLNTHGLNKYTYRDMFNSGFFWIITPLQAYLIWDVLSSPSINIQAVFVLGLMYLDSLYRLRYVQNIDMWDYLVRFIYIPQIFYAWFTIAQQAWAYVMFITKSRRSW